RCRLEVELVEGGAAAERQSAGNRLARKQLDQGAADHQILLDLAVGHPRRLLPPLGDEVLRDHRSASMLALAMSFQRSIRGAPPLERLRALVSRAMQFCCTQERDVVGLAQYPHQLGDELLGGKATQPSVLRRDDDVEAAVWIGDLPPPLEAAQCRLNSSQ